LVAWRAQVLHGLRHLHSQREKIIHFDLKPANILFNDGEVRLGPARAGGSAARLAHHPPPTAPTAPAHRTAARASR